MSDIRFFRDSLVKHFKEEIDKKNSWGKDEVKVVLSKCIGDALCELLEKQLENIQ